ncbi:MAG: chitin disaccharide deacetylase [Spirochaetaceae bacterium]|nr:chitin disaccharide deacetylase [Spirochaetaceae bacterium]
MKLIVNADDFGLSEAVNHGIVKAFTAGIVRSTTLMANMGAVSHALGLSKLNPALGTGIHLTLTAGYPLSQGAETLVDSDGVFFKQLPFFAKLEAGAVALAEVETEWRKQIEFAVELGFKVTHLDSHHHVHLRPELAALAFKLGTEYAIPVRAGKAEAEKYRANVRTTDFFSDKFYGEAISAEHIKKIIAPYIKEDVSLELMAHPAYADKTLLSATGYALARLDELDALTSGEITQYIQDNRVELTSFAGL